MTCSFLKEENVGFEPTPQLQQFCAHRVALG
jgi:hypothetical protein